MENVKRRGENHKSQKTTTKKKTGKTQPTDKAIHLKLYCLFLSLEYVPSEVSYYAFMSLLSLIHNTTTVLYETSMLLVFYWIRILPTKFEKFEEKKALTWKSKSQSRSCVLQFSLTKYNNLKNKSVALLSSFHVHKTKLRFLKYSNYTILLLPSCTEIHKQKIDSLSVLIYFTGCVSTMWLNYRMKRCFYHPNVSNYTLFDRTN